MTVVVKLSSKGQLVIPGGIRRALRLQPGARFHLEIVDRKIVLDPITEKSPIEALYGMFADEDFLGDLEREHREEVARD